MSYLPHTLLAAPVTAGPSVVLLSPWSMPQGPVHKRETVSELSSVSDSANSRWSGGHQVESEVRSGSQPSPWGLPTHLVLGQRVSWGPREQAGGLCLVGVSRALTKAACWLGPGLEAAVNSPAPPTPHPCLCDLIVVSQSAWVTVFVTPTSYPTSPFGDLRSLRVSSWALAPHMTAGNGLGPLPLCKLANRNLLSLNQNQDLRGWKLCFGILPLSCKNRE